jgi:hypothetical protein
MPAQSTTLSFYTDIYTTGTTAVLTTTSVLSMPAYYHNQSTFNPPYNVLTFPSNKEKGCGYYGISSGLHTVTYKTTQDYVGTVTMQATLSSNPVETDWFPVKDTAKTYLYNQNLQTTSTVALTFVGNFTWVRANVNISQGALLAINYNF